MNNKYSTKPVNSSVVSYGKPLSRSVLGKPIQQRKVPKQKGSKFTKYFLKGPVYLHWLEICAKQGGKCLNLGVAICFMAGLKKKQTFKIQRKFLELLCIDRGAVYSNLKKLEKVGLISVNRKNGASPVITVLVPFSENN